MFNLNTDIIFATGAVVVLVFATLAFFISRFKRCPSDKILVIYGRVGAGASCRCLHGGGAFIWLVIQECQFMDLTPIPIEIRLEGALSQQNIRVSVPSTFTVGISTEPGVMENAAERLLGLTLQDVQELAKDIIFGQMHLVIATMPIEEINADRDKLIANISAGVEVELKKSGCASSTSTSRTSPTNPATLTPWARRPPRGPSTTPRKRSPSRSATARSARRSPNATSASRWPRPTPPRSRAKTFPR